MAVKFCLLEFAGIRSLYQIFDGPKRVFVENVTFEL